MKFKSLWMFSLFIFLAPLTAVFAGTPEMDYQEGLDLYQQKQYQAALVPLQRAVQADPMLWQAYQLMSYCFGEMGFPAAALEAGDKSLKINPNNPAFEEYVNDSLRPKVTTSLGVSAPPLPPTGHMSNSFYLSGGLSNPLGPVGFTGTWTTGFNLGAGFGLALNRNISLLFDAHFDNYPLIPISTYVFDPYGGYTTETVTGGGLHALMPMINGKFVFVNADNPVLFYGLVGLGPCFYFRDALSVNGVGAYSPGYSEVDLGFRTGLGIDIKLGNKIYLTMETNDLITTLNDAGQIGYYYTNTIDMSRFNMGLRFDN